MQKRSVLQFHIRIKQIFLLFFFGSSGRKGQRFHCAAAQGPGGASLITSVPPWYNSSDWRRESEGGKSLIKQIISCWGREQLHFRAPSLSPGRPWRRFPCAAGRSVSSPSSDCVQGSESPSPPSPVRMFMHLEVFYYIFILLAHMRSYCCW